jgi:hypothetical protein
MSVTSVRHFRYMSDMSDTFARQLTDVIDICQTLQIYVWYQWYVGHLSRTLTDVRDICQTLQIYVWYIRDLFKTANRYQGDMSDTWDICPTCQTPLWEPRYLSQPASLSYIATTCLRLLHADSCLRLLQTSASDCKHISETADHLTIQLSGTADIYPLHSFFITWQNSLKIIKFGIPIHIFQFSVWNTLKSHFRPFQFRKI